MPAAWRVCVLVCVAGGAVVARPAAASMTVAFRDQHGTRTFYQDGSRIRVVNPFGDDEGAAAILDVKSTEFWLVYDDAKAYFNFNKVFTKIRPMYEKALKTRPTPRRGPGITYRSLGKTRLVNGFSCAVYEGVRAGRVVDETCFATWGGAIGQEEEFAWLNVLPDRLVVGMAGKRQPALIHGGAPGLEIWTSAIADDGSREVVEIVKVSRDPLPLAMFKIPPDFTEISRPLTASEHQPVAAPRVEDVGAPTPAARPRGKITGLVAIILMIGLAIGVLFHTFILHLAAKVVLKDARVTQALVAAGIVWLMLAVVELMHLPSVLSLGIGALATFASLKISYGASVPRTLALFVVSGLIAIGAGLAAGATFS